MDIFQDLKAHVQQNPVPRWPIHLGSAAPSPAESVTLGGADRPQLAVLPSGVLIMKSKKNSAAYPRWKSVQDQIEAESADPKFLRAELTFQARMLAALRLQALRASQGAAPKVLRCQGRRYPSSRQSSDSQKRWPRLGEGKKAARSLAKMASSLDSLGEESS